MHLVSNKNKIKDGLNVSQTITRVDVENTFHRTIGVDSKVEIEYIV